MLKAVRPLLDQRTIDKVVDVRGSDEEMMQKLKDDHHFPATAIKWLAETLKTGLKDKYPPFPAPARPLFLPKLIKMFDFQHEEK
eukprot:CAMPEP_0175169036 /NCGR_PEP_ID=MMETSP0087-20121206/29323_1 /TAXON_ID=136419 /ORGANISM="Unknown Unknown, Strain D1" /LENGTH=83 /DNA_ID=CAMNT_0016459289 /DNA_START=335 /DNA_END=586 /DNA_ORIENTATION=+